jgi:hypothetical protein
MKKLIAILLIALSAKSGIAQNYNPAVWAGIVSPAPMLQGLGQVQFNVGNLGNDAMGNLAQPMLLVITLSNGEPNPNPMAALSGTLVNKFTWLYDPLIRSYLGTQNAPLAGFEAGSIIIGYKVTVASGPANPQNGFNVNVTPPAYTNASNAPGDDNVSSYTYGSLPIVAPVKLVSFDVAVNSCKSSVSWKSATESNFKQYELEYSTDGIHYTSVNTTTGQGDNTPYSFAHNPAQGKAYYRLKMVDLDGKVEYSKIIALDVNCGKGSILVYPNPASDFVNINITGADSKGTQATMYNAAGQKVMSRSLQNGSHQLDISRLASGVYHINLVNSNGTENVKLVVQ